MTNSKVSSNHYLIVATGIALCVGPSALTMNCAGIFFTPVSEALGVGKGAFAFYMTVLCLAMFFTLPVAGKLMATQDVRVVLSAAVITVGASLFAMGFFDAVWQFYIAGAFIGIGQSFLLYLAVPTLINRWFRQKAGFFLGLCMAFTGVGGVLFNPLGDYLIQHYGWQTGYRVFGGLALLIALPFTLLAIRSYPADKNLRPYGDIDQGDGAPTMLFGVLATDALKSRAFYALVIFAGLTGFVSVVYQFLPSYASSLPLNNTIPALAGTLAAAAMAGQAVGKLGLGVISDKSISAGMWTAILCGIIGLLVLWLLPSYLSALLIAGFLFGPFYACALVQVPLMTKAVFGIRDYSQIYSRISMFSAIMAALGATAWGYLIDWLGFPILFIASLAILVVIALLGNYAIKSRAKLKWSSLKLPV
jgi:MFS family permease